MRELLKREIGEAIRREIPVSEAGLITVNDVDVAGDLQLATVFISILGTAEQKEDGARSCCAKNRKRIQGLVGRAVVLKYTPQLALRHGRLRRTGQSRAGDHRRTREELLIAART